MRYLQARNGRAEHHFGVRHIGELYISILSLKEIEFPQKPHQILNTFSKAENTNSCSPRRAGPSTICE